MDSNLQVEFARTMAEQGQRHDTKDIRLLGPSDEQSPQNRISFWSVDSYTTTAAAANSPVVERIGSGLFDEPTRWLNIGTNKPRATLQQKFKQLAANWKTETGSQSITTLRYASPYYHSILAMGKDVIPLILSELRRSPDWWFEALKTLADFTPVKPGMKFNEAVSAWIEWGIQNGYIARET
jgi:hypothetical protein